MKRFEIGKSYRARDQRMGAVKVLDRVGNRMTVEYETGKRDVMTIFFDRNGYEAASEFGDCCSWMLQYSAAIVARI